MSPRKLWSSTVGFNWKFAPQAVMQLCQVQPKALLHTNCWLKGSQIVEYFCKRNLRMYLFTVVKTVQIRACSKVFCDQSVRTDEASWIRGEKSAGNFKIIWLLQFKLLKYWPEKGSCPAILHFFLLYMPSSCLIYD